MLKIHRWMQRLSPHNSEEVRGPMVYWTTPGMTEYNEANKRCPVHPLSRCLAPTLQILTTPADSTQRERRMCSTCKLRFWEAYDCTVSMARTVALVMGMWAGHSTLSGSSKKCAHVSAEIPWKYLSPMLLLVRSINEYSMWEIHTVSTF